MSYKIIETKRYENKCDQCGYRWESDSLPRRCARCKRYTWNGTKTTLKRYEYKGRSLTVKDWASEIGMSYQRLAYRIRQGWPMEDCLYPGKFKAGKIPDDPKD